MLVLPWNTFVTLGFWAFLDDWFDIVNFLRFWMCICRNTAAEHTSLLPKTHLRIFDLGDFSMKMSLKQHSGKCQQIIDRTGFLQRIWTFLCDLFKHRNKSWMEQIIYREVKSEIQNISNVFLRPLHLFNAQKITKKPAKLG